MLSRDLIGVSRPEMRAAANLAFANAVADGLSSPATMTEPAAVKVCGSCRRSLPRTSFSDKQWLNKKFRGEGRRCGSCLSGIQIDPSLMASTVASISAAQGSKSFLADWTVAWQQVQDDALLAHANDAVHQDANEDEHSSRSRGPTQQGRLLAVLIRNLDARGASKAEKAAHRALAEECWAALSGRPQLSPTARTVPRASPGVHAGWMGGAGLLANTDTGRGKAGRGSKALAAVELAAAVMRHVPTLGLGPDIADDLIFLPCHAPAADGGLAVERALSSIHAAGGAFAHAHRAWAVCETATTATHAVLAGRRLLKRALDASPGATFAIRCESYPPPAATMGRSAVVEAIAADVGNTVDLQAPDVCLLLRGVHIGGAAHCALALERRSLPSLLRSDHGDDFASEGRPYFVREANGAPPPPPSHQAMDEAVDEPSRRAEEAASRALIDEGEGLAGLVRRLEAALTGAAAILSPVSRHALYRTGIDTGSAAAMAHTEASQALGTRHGHMQGAGAGSSEAVDTNHASTQPESLYASGKARGRHK